MKNSKFVGAIFLIAASVSAATKPDAPQAQTDSRCSTVLGRQQSAEFCAQQDRQRVTPGAAAAANTSLAGKGVASAPQFTVNKSIERDQKSQQQAGTK